MTLLITPSILALSLSLSLLTACTIPTQRVFVDTNLTLSANKKTTDKTQFEVGVYYAVKPTKYVEFYTGVTHRSNYWIKGDNLKGTYIEGGSVGMLISKSLTR